MVTAIKKIHKIMRPAAARQKASDKYVGEQKKQLRHGKWR